MTDELKRTEILIGTDAVKKLKASHAAVFGVGGVGGYAAEALARSGIGHLDLIDNDIVSVSNINRQIYALHSTVGQYKVDAAKRRISDINPNAEVTVHKTFYMPGCADEFDFTKYDYIIDAIDTVTAKIELIVRADAVNVPVISAMGAGNKLNPTLFEVDDIYNTSVCPLAKVMRYELKRRGVKKLKVVYSKEKPIKPCEFDECSSDNRRQPPGSIAYVPPVVGLIAAGEVIRDIIGA